MYNIKNVAKILPVRVSEDCGSIRIRFNSRTTGVLAHGAGTTGVQGADVRIDANADPTPIIVLQQNNLNEGGDEDIESEVIHPEEDENDNFDEETITLDILPALDNEENSYGEDDGVLADINLIQGGNINAPAQDGVQRRSTRARKKPTAYKPSYQNKTYAHQGVININVLEDQNLRKFTEIDQTFHVIGVALCSRSAQPEKGLKLFGQEGKNAIQKEMQQHHDMETYFPVDPSKLTYNDKRKPLRQW